MRYIIGLLASDSDQYCIVSNELFSDISQGYILSKNSHPHITLCQFNSDDPKLVNRIWEEIKISNILNTSNFKITIGKGDENGQFLKDLYAPIDNID